jgi:hypothetical protein
MFFSALHSKNNSRTIAVQRKNRYNAPGSAFLVSAASEESAIKDGCSGMEIDRIG